MWEVIYLNRSISKLKRVFEESISNYIILYLRKELATTLKIWISTDSIQKLSESTFNKLFENKDFVHCEIICLDMIRYHSKNIKRKEQKNLWEKRLESVQEWKINQAIAKRNALKANYLCENMIELAKLSWDKRKLVKWLWYNQIAKSVLYEQYLDLGLNTTADKLKEQMISFYNWLDMEPQIKEMWLSDWETRNTDLPINNNIVWWNQFFVNS